MFEMDCKMVDDDVNSIKITNSEYDLIMEDCRTSLLSYYNSFVAVFTKRQTDKQTTALMQIYLMLLTIFLM
ncbi:unnamed protein product [Trifolium pratense]|uniref:Uncharacterized protein n=1 Tax=Trifolium pratense TaxID=57577 RepID=A0ACB0LD83_TRIPR|nr:unnamed protein product [Trifolium pratense]